MNIRIPRSGQAARLAKAYLASQGLDISHSQALELIARLHGYSDTQAMKADTRFADAPALQPISSNEYELRAKPHSAWIGVDNISVSVTRTDEGVCVDLYAKGFENKSLAGTSLFFHEAQEETDDQQFGQAHAGSPAEEPLCREVIDDVGYEIVELADRPGRFTWVAPTDDSDTTFGSQQEAFDNAWKNACQQTVAILDMSIDKFLKLSREEQCAAIRQALTE
jgi:hypothetical protein